MRLLLGSLLLVSAFAYDFDPKNPGSSSLHQALGLFKQLTLSLDQWKDLKQMLALIVFPLKHFANYH